MATLLNGILLTGIPKPLGKVFLNLSPSGTSIETVDHYTLPANTLLADGDIAAVAWRVQQTVANACTITVDCPSNGVTLLADARSTACDRRIWLLLERISSTTVRKCLTYLYGTGTWYDPAPQTAGISNALSAIDCYLRFTNGTANTDMKVLSREVFYYPVS